ncbi:hypothetical protein EMPS_01729 [Entomortierella parvispora]|uniref:Uncharacterized protein n=1 Tax=Entomortierella parvispora TaxID=205924 RepID=A0A9P3LSV7_9FUNG|nr:hypothetical protein EMPS_01729 [Entomortierella parvispora]
MPRERAPRAAKKKAAEALHELVQQDEELTRIITYGDTHLNQDSQHTSQSQPQNRVNGADGDGREKTRQRHGRADSDSDEGDSWKPLSKKRRKSPELQDSKGKRPRSTNRQSESDSGSDKDQHSYEQSAIKGNGSKKSTEAKSKRSIASKDQAGRAKAVERKAKRRKEKLQRTSAEKEASDLDSNEDNSSSESEDSHDDEDDDVNNINDAEDDDDEEADQISAPVMVKKEDEDIDFAQANESSVWENGPTFFGQSFKGGEKPLTSMVHTLMTQEQKAMSALSLMALDPRKKDENYRWPVREGFLPSIPESASQFMNVPRQVHDYDEHAAKFVKELTGVPKTTKDYSDTSSESSDHEMDEELEPHLENHNEESGAEYDVEADEARRELRQREARAARKKRKHERHADERAANTRLLQVQKFFNEEMTSFGQRQYRKGKEHRMDHDVRDILREKILPLYRDTAMSTKVLNPDDEPDDEMTTIQERALAFAAENRTRKILDRLPWVIRQGALGAVPLYVANGVPKPVTTEAEFERGWDTIMAAASMAGVEDRILKKVSLRMQNLLSHSNHPARYEPPPKARFSNDISPGSSDILHSSIPHYLTGEFIDPLDPKFRLDALVKNKYKILQESLSTRLDLKNKGQASGSENEPLQKVE